MSDQPGLALVVNSTPRTLRALRLLGTAPGLLPMWTADVDGFVGCAGSLEAAILAAARAAEMEKETGGEG